MAVNVVLTWILGKEHDRVLYKWTEVARDRYRNGIYESENILRKKYNITTCERLSSFLGIDIIYDLKEGILSFGVEEKIKTIFEDKPYLNVIRPSTIPMKVDTDHKIKIGKNKDDDELFQRRLSDPKEFASVVGALIYNGSACRADIAHANGRISQKMHSPDEQSICHLRTLLGYLRRTSKYKLHFYREKHPIQELLSSYGTKDPGFLDLLVSDDSAFSPPLQVRGNTLFGQSDADYANKLEESKKSTSGYVFFHCHNLVCWRSKLQPIIATSTHEAELIAILRLGNCVTKSPPGLLNSLL